MINPKARQRLLASTIVAGAVALFGVSAVTAIPTVASAQDYTTGSLSGGVTSEGGAPVAGATVTIRSLSQGFTRTVTTNENGSFRLSLIPVGAYELRISADGYGPVVDPNVAVRLGADTSYQFSLASASSSTLDDVVVTGTRQNLDFAQTTTGLTVDVSELVERLPVARSLTSVALLAPRTVQGDTAFGDVPSLGGSSVAENAYYLNGLNITNFDTYVGGAPVPFDFYQTVEIKTGGYPAEFGRATGGVLNAVSKSGSNEFTFAVHGNYTPNGLRSTSPDTYQNVNSRRESDNLTFTVEAGGPIIRDRLFAYGLYQWQDIEIDSYSISNNWRQVSRIDSPFVGLKLDGYITDDHHLEFTYFDSTTEDERTYYTFNNATGAVGANSFGGRVFRSGGENWVARYTGKFTDWLTLSAAYGVNQDSNAAGEVSDPTAPYAVDWRSGSGSRVSSQIAPASDFQDTERKFYRFDADVLFNWRGEHHVRMGMDNEDTELNHLSSSNGGMEFYYFTGPDDFAPAGQDYIDVYVRRLGGTDIKAENRSYYIQDAWDITPDFSVQLGLRYDEFTIYNLLQEKVVTLGDNWGPRASFTLDPFGNGDDKFYASYGRYFIPPASNLAFRGKDFMVDAYFLPAGGAATLTLDPVTGLPVGGVGAPIINPDLSICPDGMPFGVSGLRACAITGAGTQDPADAKYAKGTKATFEDEFVLGYQKQLNDLWSVGAAVTYRNLGRISEDMATDYLVNRYCESIGIDCSDQFYGDHQYVIHNPGEDLTFLVREALPNGTRPTLTFTAAEVGLPKAKREYMGLEVTFEREFDGVWGLQGSYVASESIGNYEGTVLSDNGQDDAGSTILYDHLGLTDGTYGLLPNHRGHQFKLFGSYQLMENLTLGANAVVMSPRKYGCLGRHPTDPAAGGYGASSRYCPPAAGQPSQLVPRGTAFEGDWISQLDLSLRYQVPTFGIGSGLTLRADVFNVFNQDAVEDYQEVGTNTNGGYVSTYRRPLVYQTPRYVRIGFDWAF